MKRSTFFRNTFSLDTLLSPTPQKSDGRSRVSTARQNADTLDVGVAWSSIDCFRGGTLSLLVAASTVDSVLFEI